MNFSNQQIMGPPINGAMRRPSMPVTGTAIHSLLADQVIKGDSSVGNAKINPRVDAPLFSTDEPFVAKTAAILNYSNTGEVIDPTQSYVPSSKLTHRIGNQMFKSRSTNDSYPEKPSGPGTSAQIL